MGRRARREGPFGFGRIRGSASAQGAGGAAGEVGRGGARRARRGARAHDVLLFEAESGAQLSSKLFDSNRMVVRRRGKMPRYWVVAPYNSEFPDIWEKVWSFDLSNGIISIGWTELGDVSALAEEELRSAIEAIYPNYKPQGRTLAFNMLWAFYHRMSEGDFVVARRGRKRIAGVGSVAGRPYFSAGKIVEATGEGRAYPNHMPIQWRQSPRDKPFPNMVFGMQTLYEVTEATFKALVGDALQTEAETSEEGVEDRSEFVLEKYLEDFIVTNFDTIFGGRLVLYRDPKEDAVGQQYATDVGVIDILAVEPETNSFVVIELKKGRETDRVVGQTLRYMGWVSENLCSEGQDVKGMVICREPDPRLIYATKMAPNVQVRYYKVSFRLAS